MGELARKARKYDVVKGKLGTNFVRVTGCKRLDRMVAKEAMKREGIVRPCKSPFCEKSGRGQSYFAKNWRNYIGWEKNK
jgi:hypothetical protein